MRKIKFIMLCVVFIISLKASSQDQRNKLLQNINPIEPTTASLGKYGAFPVDYSTGLVPISIPLYEIKSGNIFCNIELSYHGGGIKLKDEASWVGLGWDLNFGGTISRTINGFPDEEEKRPVPNYQDITLSMNNYDIRPYLYYSHPVCPWHSFKPDLFYYNFNDNNGTFCVNYNDSTDVYGFPLFIVPNGIRGKVYSENINLTNNAGIDYNFIATEKTFIINGATANIFNSNYSLESIISPNKTDTIKYEYQTDGSFQKTIYSHSQIRGTTVTYPINFGTIATYSPSEPIKFSEYSNDVLYTQDVDSKKPKYIYFKGGRVVFNLSQRTDLDTKSTLKKLDNIVIEQYVNNSYVILKKIQFNYTYFNNGQGYNSQRLKLISVEEITPDNNKKMLASFDYYYEAPLPSKDSYSFDYWGYYNGKNNGSDIPLAYYDGEIIGGADKTPDIRYSKSGTLKSITYPTKGKTEFIWEENRVNNNNKPIYNVPETKIADVTSQATTSCVDNANYSKIDSITFHSYIFQHANIRYFSYRKAPELDMNYNLHVLRDKVQIYLNDELIPNVVESEKILKEKTVQLNANTDYTLKIISSCSNIDANAVLEYISYNPANYQDNFNQPFGGLRINRITDYNNNGDIILQKKYSYLDKKGYSSGYVTNTSNLTCEKNLISYTYWMGTLGLTNITQPTKLEKREGMVWYNNPITTLKISDIAYEYVQEEIIAPENIGYTDYTFNKCGDVYISDDIDCISKSHLRKAMLSKIMFKDNRDTVSILRNFYSKDSRIQNKKTGFLMENGIKIINYYPGYILPMEAGHMFQARNYNITSDWLHLDSTVVRDFTAQTVFIKTKTEYKYGSIIHLQPTEIKTLTSTGDAQKINIQYPSDINTNIYTNMTNNNMLIFPIDTKKYYLKAGQTDKLIEGVYNTYTKDGYNHIVLTKVSEYLPTAILSDLFSYKYNSKARLIEATGKDNTPTSIYWDINNMYPVVIAKNMSYATLLNAVSNNFSPLTFPLSPLCINAQVTTYTYKPLVGMLTKTDPRGVTTYYEYDTFGRLVSIKEKDGKILQKFSYHYKP